jgi:hypothetical protein
VRGFGHPIGVNAEKFHLIAPYETDARKWLEMEWIDQYTGNRYHISTTADHGTRNCARVKTYGDVLMEYEFHPESKCADENGEPCTRQTVGLLSRRHARVHEIKYIGKESNLLEEVESGLIHDPMGAYTNYVDERRDEWETKIRPALKKIPLSLLEKTSGLSRRTLINARTGKNRPRLENRELLTKIVRDWGKKQPTDRMKFSFFHLEKKSS